MTHPQPPPPHHHPHLYGGVAVTASSGHPGGGGGAIVHPGMHDGGGGPSSTFMGSGAVNKVGRNCNNAFRSSIEVAAEYRPSLAKMLVGCCFVSLSLSHFFSTSICPPALV